MGLVVKRNSMPKLLQINITANWGSTGKIAELIGKSAVDKGWDSIIVYGERANPSSSALIHVGSGVNRFLHYSEQLLFDNEGQASRFVTKRFINEIKRISPDIIHLHNIHDHFLNYKILFTFLNSTDIPIVWTFHDFWAVTGRCYHFVTSDCYKWTTECQLCPQSKRMLPANGDYVRAFFLQKKQLLTANNDLHIVAVSDWVGECVKKSFLGGKDLRVIYNGVDCSVFKPTAGFSHPKITEKSFVLLAVSSQWKSKKKGLQDYLLLSKLLKENEVIVLVGVNKKIIAKLPDNIIGITNTNNQRELAAIYTRADVVLSFSQAETFGMTIVESYACGTPAVVYNNTALPALITSDTGFTVPNNDYKAAYEAIQTIKKNGKSHYTNNCIQLALSKYSLEACTANYIKLYETIINKSR